MKKTFFAALILLTSISSWAAIKTQVLDYKDGKTKLQGYVAYDDASTEKRPSVLIVHEWWGHDEYVRKRTEQVAALGYVAFAVDMYGTGVNTRDFKEAARLSGIYKGDRNLMRQRINAALNVLRKDSRIPFVDGSKVAAIGYCFGGTTVLELARSGADVNGVVSFHGGLDTPNIDDAKKIKTKVLVLHGADDPYVTNEQVLAFEDEMRKANVDWQLTKYSGSVHGFTNAGNGTDNSKGMAYNANADRRSWEAMKQFFNEIFK